MVMVISALKRLFSTAKSYRVEPSVSGIPSSKGLPDWAAFLGSSKSEWSKLRSGAKSPKVLIASNVGGHGPVSVMESMLSVALTVRGAEIHTLLCDGVLPGCLRAEYSDIPDPRVLADYRLMETACPGCLARGNKVFQPLGLTLHYLGQNLQEDQKQEARKIAAEIDSNEIKNVKYRGVSVGEHAYAGALRYFARGDLSTEPLGEVVLRRYLEAAILSAVALETLIEREKFDIACFHHGLYIPQGIVGEVCRKHGVRVVNWFVAYRRNSFIFSHEDTYHHTLMTEPVADWEGMKWSEKQENEISSYLKSRWYGNRDWISFHEKPDEDFNKYIDTVGMNRAKPTIGMLTNVMWDAQLHYPANAFPNMLQWVLRTISYFAGRPDLQLLMRVHPAEIRGTARSRQPLVDEINKAFPKLPDNVFVIPPESPVSTYAAMETCDSVLIYGTKTGVELTAVGIPVIVAGEAWIKNKGLTLDASTEAEYFKLLEKLPLRSRNGDEARLRAKKYAFHFFFRRMIPLPYMRANQKPTLFDINIQSLDDFAPRKYPGLDVVCDGILAGKPFIYPAEIIGIHDND